MPSSEKPTQQQIDRAIALITKAAQKDYFFDRLQNEHWVKPLWEKGFFRNPPQLEELEEGKFVRFPIWSESRYLTRVARKAPQNVLQVIRQMPQTDNPRVQEDFVDVALAMPVKEAAEIARMCVTWLDNPYQLLLYEKVGRLMQKLAGEGETDKAFRLADALLDVTAKARGLEAAAVQEKFQIDVSTEAEPRCDSWEYGEILKNNYPALVAADSLRAFGLLCDKLEKALRLEGHQKDEGEDYSVIWRPAVEGHSQNIEHGLKHEMIRAIRDAGERIIAQHPEMAHQILSELESRPFKIFQRVALHLLRSCSGIKSEWIAERLCSKSLLEDIGVRHEYFLLLSEHFSSLALDAKEKILQWIGAGPPGDDQPVIAEEAEARRKIWQRDLLAAVKDYLSPEWVARYQELVESVGEAEHPGFPSYSVSWVGEESPLSTEDIERMDLRELVEFLGTWAPPPKQFLGPSVTRVGMGMQLTTHVKKDPSSLARAATEFKDLHPVYVRHFLRGLEEAFKEGKTFDWASVLALSKSVVQEHPSGSSCASQPEDEDGTDWRSVRRVVAGLLQEGLGHTENAIPFELREAVWEILKPLTQDDDPTPDFESRYGGDNSDPPTMAINTVRGVAMHGVVRYALWCRRYFLAKLSGGDEAGFSFNSIPEVRGVLETRLDPSTEPSVAIRSVYGQTFPWLVLLDKSWAQSHISAIFPRQDGLQHLRSAAWEAYVSFCTVYDEVIEILLGEYEFALQSFAAPAVKRFSKHSAERFAQHLMLMYWRGLIHLKENGSMVSSFFEKASVTLSAEAIKFVGLILNRIAGDEIPNEVLKRLQALWEFRLHSVRAATDEAYKEELVAFGWWFGSRVFEPSWALEHLHDTVLLTKGTIDAESRVAERLASLAEQFPVETLSCLDCLLRPNQDIRYKLLSIRGKAARDALRGILRGGNNSARSKATQLIHDLGAYGFDLRELLQDQ